MNKFIEALKTNKKLYAKRTLYIVGAVGGLILTAGVIKKFNDAANQLPDGDAVAE